MILNQRWSSKLVFLVASIGVAIGLGNIWRFPTMVGQNGGGAFVIIYLLALLFIGLPLLTGEMLLGRLTRQNVSETFLTLSHKAGASKHWQHMGLLCFAIMVIAMAIYSVIAGWINAYIYFGATNTLGQLTPEQTSSFFHDFTSNPGALILCHTLYLAMVLSIVALGLHNGIERAVRWLMPLFLLLLIVLVGYALSYGNTSKALTYIFKPDFSKITSKGIMEALSHACYTLTIGGGVMLVYGAYTQEKFKLGPCVLVIGLVDTLVALLAGFIIFPIVFANGLSPDEGPGLIFTTLPIAFQSMRHGALYSTLMFVFIWIAAFSSSIAQAEPMVLQCEQKFNLSRIKATALVGLIVWSLGVLVIFSFNILADFHLIYDWTIFQCVDNLLSLVLLPASLLLLAIFLGWILPKELSLKGLDFKQHWLYEVWRFCIRYLVVVSILAIALY